MGRRIVVGVATSSHDTHEAVAWAAAEAARRHVPLQLMHSIGLLLERMSATPEHVRTALAATAQDVVDQAAARVARLTPDVDVEAIVDLDRSPSAALASVADAEMIVLGSHDRTALGDLLASSTAPKTLARASCPVVVVRPHAGDEEGGATATDTAVGVDGSSMSQTAVEWAFQEASLWKTGVTAVHVWRLPGVGGSEPTMYGLLEPAQLERARQEHAALLSESLAGWREQCPDVPVREDLREGHPGQALVEASATARLLVVGTRGLGGFPGLLLGSVSSAVLHHAQCPVMVVRP